DDNSLDASVIVGRAAIETAWTLPEEFEAGQTVQMTLRLTNAGDRDAEQVQLTLTDPGVAGFEIVSTDPDPDGPGLAWQWPTVGPGQSVEVVISASLDHALSGEVLLAGSADHTDRAAADYPPLDVSLVIGITADHTEPAALVELSALRTSVAPVQVRVEANEPLQGVPTVTARDTGDHLMAVSYEGQDGGGYLYSVDVTAAAEGAVSVRATVSDLAGNVGTATATFVVDRTPPAFQVSIEGDLLGAGQHTAV
ncbi:unnamed protein product, partial [marine sediment metagenome]